jgi:thioredoxin-like negative regulator of GroEL
MSALMIRLAILVLVAFAARLLVLLGKRFVEGKRQLALAAAPIAQPIPGSSASTIRILSFSSEDCRQCKLQAPILQRIVAMHKDAISITEIDAPAAPELTTRYQILTVPTTVVLDAYGNAHAINYGFANTQKLLQQINALLAV